MDIQQIMPGFNTRTDVEVYASLYGCSPKEMLKYETVEPIMEVSIFSSYFQAFSKGLLLNNHIDGSSHLLVAHETCTNPKS
jgi:hypothetical protein